MAIRDMPIPPDLEKSPIVPEILGLASKHPTELVMALLGKVMKRGILRSNINSEGHVLILNGPKGCLSVSIVSRWWLRGRARSGLTGMRG